ncbi:MAG: putative glycosyltransferase [Rhodospirillales bacterium]|nr:putative glycosyltransferase [Rhodospirillales bacterium]
MSLADVSIIVPIGPGDESWRDLARDLDGSDAELIWVATEPAPADAPAGRWLVARPGRAQQLNDGARAATRGFLWFLHADTRLEASSLAALAASLQPDALLWFDLAFATDGAGPMRLNALGANLRARLLGVPFGDQGFALSRATFERIGPYDETAPYGEDHLLLWRARRAGVKLVQVGATLTTSARAYRTHGWLRVTLTYQWRWLRQAWRARQ